MTSDYVESAGYVYVVSLMNIPDDMSTWEIVEEAKSLSGVEDELFFLDIERDGHKAVVKLSL